MRIVPVLDLKGGIVVHARRGARDRYAPLRSALVDGADPVDVARTLVARCGAPTLYVADLDALGGAIPDATTLAALGAVAEPWVDAGAVDDARAGVLGEAGAARNVIGTESLTDLAPTLTNGPPLVLSVDLRDGRLLSPVPELSGGPPTAAATLATTLGVAELIVIDLARVGSGEGPPTEAVAALVAALPGVAVYAGGGVRDDADLRALQAAGATGALVATALHEGRITP